jgi:hypothetical protein
MIVCYAIGSVVTASSVIGAIYYFYLAEETNESGKEKRG